MSQISAWADMRPSLFCAADHSFFHAPGLRAGVSWCWMWFIHQDVVRRWLEQQSDSQLTLIYPEAPSKTLNQQRQSWCTCWWTKAWGEFWVDAQNLIMGGVSKPCPALTVRSGYIFLFFLFGSFSNFHTILLPTIEWLYTVHMLCLYLYSMIERQARALNRTQDQACVRRCRHQTKRLALHH